MGAANTRRNEAASLLRKGKSIKQIAKKMGISKDTVKRYLRADARSESDVRYVQGKRSRPHLVFGDLHAPYHHERAIEFLQHVHARYKCRERVYCVGDLFDFHSMSRHTTELDSSSPDVEYHKALAFAEELSTVFPDGTLVLGNHDRIPQRQMKEASLSHGLLKGLNELYGLPDTWKIEHLYSVIDDGDLDVLLEHGVNSTGQLGAINTAMSKQSNYCQGHMHSFAGVNYRASHFSLRWGMNTGCLVDNTSLAMRYGKYAKNKGVLGCGLVYPASGMVGEHAIFVPMGCE